MTTLRRTLTLLIVPAAVVALAAPASASPALAPVSAGPIVATAPVATGIIMRDGGVCDPIRHMGC